MERVINENNPHNSDIGIMSRYRGRTGGPGAKRARYHSNLIDVNVTEPRDKLENFAETYVTLITERDVMGDGLPIYHINRVVEETGKKFQDKAHITYEVLAERVRYFKEDEEGVACYV